MSNQVGFGGGTSCATQTINTGDACNASQEDKTKLPGSTRVVGKTGEKFITVQIWDTIGCADDNIVRMYNKDQCVYKDGLYYWSITDGNITEPGSDLWTTGITGCEMLKPSNSSTGTTTLTLDAVCAVLGTATDNGLSF